MIFSSLKETSFIDLRKLFPFTFFRINGIKQKENCKNTYLFDMEIINRQKIIQKCNEIISKYYSIENLLYNQIKLENLYKDYKWNNPSLNKFGNNRKRGLLERKQLFH